ncbi:lysin B [Mycobacterium phage ArcherS7]|uniref:Lysin B n=16 Tax=Bixzunavirus TaxID=680114 RepID=Q852W7_BPMBZ|nr:gp238 [Mycobacterium phage Bxz1]YP_002224463.1 gp244 [Mycobacterium phage Spud]YP_008061023.1 lysin B [Mycobacterium phage Gizmo]YP_008061480.1 lysin B [Mycobacterium phage ArcherS7]YP_009013001.1 lysin B [Mycobacterium phage Dandelion]YP_009016680.1 lysin B [Mycobacterium phage Nappy]YP_009017550.1 lysin B [Mycobacterium phage MoMoMixon]YP_009017994.1 lysin B [Mycobacterium phage Pleione]YP_010057625.1 lysin B [Mycobacterium phage CharlieB]ACU41737.1 lysin B [Mycobacterium phage LRRHoo
MRVPPVTGEYVGLGLGDSSEEIRKIKEFMRKKFRSYAGHLADTPHYDEQMTAVVAEMQGRYNQDGKLATGKYTPGIINAETKYVMNYLERPAGPDNRPVLFTVCGTGVPWWVGPDAETARQVEDLYRWQPVGYPAAPFPMGPSIEAGKAELRAQINRMEPGFELRKQVERNGMVLAGYSQGAIVTSEVWEDDIRTSGPIVGWAKDHVLKAVAWGNPNREQGKAYPDAGAPLAAADSAGITGRLMTDTPDWWRNYAHQGDLYTATRPGESREDKVAIWQIVRGTNILSGPDSLLRQFLEIAEAPVPNAIAAFQAFMDAGLFFVKGTRPHTNYHIGAAVDYLRS